VTSAQRSGAATRVRSRLVEPYHGPLRRLALTYVRSGAVTDGVVQETWLGLITGIDRFEGRSSPLRFSSRSPAPNRNTRERVAARPAT
jgi:RNA polymerase sigma-70 factor, ECF subfamily